MQKRSLQAPRINQVVDSTAGCSLLSFLNCYSGYHQIPLKEEDQIKTSFTTSFGAFCYTTMPFRLKSAGATYQRGIQWCLHSQLQCNVEVCVDDIVVKTWEDEGLISDLPETFNNLRKFKMKLNPERLHSVCPQENYSAIWSPVMVLILTQRRCQLIPI
jgi:hypothetical protein